MNNTTAEEPGICEVGGSGLWLPLGGDAEAMWPSELKIFLYLLGLIYCFLGVAIIADVFMSAIEKVTSVKKQVMSKELEKKVTVKVWNDTVANLTLMALGSSAPEILLSVIELVGANFYSGSLGASTIVGSAAFNLLGITAVCIAALPNGEIKQIKDQKVFAITGTFSIFAYLWMLVILVAFSEDMVEPWEGVITFLFFPLLVILSYMADIGMFGSVRQPTEHIVLSQVTTEQLAELMMKVRQDFGGRPVAVRVKAALQHELRQRRSRAVYRVAAVRDMAGGKKVAGINDKTRAQLDASRASNAGNNAQNSASNNTNSNAFLTEAAKSKEKASCVEFVSSRFSVLESVGKAKFGISRHGDLSVAVNVLWKTRSGNEAKHAKDGKDFKMQEGNVEFEPGSSYEEVEVEIIDDDQYEDDQEFYIEINAAVCATKGVDASIGEKKEATVVIVDDDLPGLLSFEREEIQVQESHLQQEMEITVRRRMGASGEIKCRARTEDWSAKAGADYGKVDEELIFKPGQMEAFIKVQIMPKGRYESTEKFRLILEDPTGGAKFDSTTDGGSDSCVCTVVILADTKNKPLVDKIFSTLSPNWDEVALGNAAWIDQFVEAMYCGGSKEEQKNSSWFEFVLHVLSLPWKLIFALVPPTEYCGGWLCFFIALAMIGCVTIIIGDLASLLGCSMQISDLQTAITLVAMGTSLPDTFASRTAALQDEYADASIGNVTGSNSVNVFLGIGLPWMIGAIYWNVLGPTDEWKAKYPRLMTIYPDGGFIVKSTGLAFSVAVFSCCAVVCFAVLIARRAFLGGELGGPKPMQYVSGGVLACLWALYIGLSIWNDSQNN
ncbi:Sodium/calcium exchanger 3 (Na(+)/Ca(2+)-exchange protein 3) (Solute carrier family 8 member 3) [Durusdinium trenchii]|uniref:Sodium/calcium exchanger 3 (Na(+)/Ca(2+)-exchange protein 3) (Solute carrier family 8 member 3) n=1 Tax=Durusdinium trenchii TaxID=1381693 RepID=A0ABP0PEJ8_9DINO